MENGGRMQPGETRNPRGRPKGVKTRMTILRENAFAKAMKGRKTPLEFLLGVMESESASASERIDAAKAAAPYVHKRQPLAIENSPNGPFRVFDVVKLAGMTEVELETLRNLIGKAQPDDLAPTVIEHVAATVAAIEHEESIGGDAT